MRKNRDSRLPVSRERKDDRLSGGSPYARRKLPRPMRFSLALIGPVGAFANLADVSAVPLPTHPRLAVFPSRPPYPPPTNPASVSSSAADKKNREKVGRTRQRSKYLRTIAIFIVAGFLLCFYGKMTSPFFSYPHPSPPAPPFSPSLPPGLNYTYIFL